MSLHRRVRFVLVGSLLLAAAFAGGATLALSTDFNQEITPLNCQVSSIDTGTYTSTSITPQGCVSIVTVLTGQKPSAPASSTNKGNNPAPTSKQYASVAKLPYQPVAQPVHKGGSLTGYRVTSDLIITIAVAALGLVVIVLVLVFVI